MKNPKVSVIIPVYNIEEYLPKCLDSLCAQTFEEKEIIVVNDASSDNSQRIIDHYCGQDSRIRPFVNSRNLGLFLSRLEGLKWVRGQHVTFVDGDDYIEPSAYEVMHEKAVTGKFDIVACRINRFAGGHVNREFLKNVIVDEAIYGYDILRNLLLKKISNSVWNKLYRIEIDLTQYFPMENLLKHIIDAAQLEIFQLKHDNDALVLRKSERAERTENKAQTAAVFLNLSKKIIRKIMARECDDSRKMKIPKKKTLITGSHRSGTTCLWQILRAGNCLSALSEPFNKKSKYTERFTFGCWFPCLAPAARNAEVVDALDYSLNIEKKSPRSLIMNRPRKGRPFSASLRTLTGLFASEW